MTSAPVPPEAAEDAARRAAEARPAEQARGLYQSWTQVALGSGMNSATWRAMVPRDLEGNYQVDLTATDVLGNRNDKRSTWGLWRGEIDTRPPRVGISSSSWYEAGVRRTDITAWAEDLNLTSDRELIFGRFEIIDDDFIGRLEDAAFDDVQPADRKYMQRSRAHERLGYLIR